MASMTARNNGDITSSMRRGVLSVGIRISGAVENAIT